MKMKRVVPVVLTLALASSLSVTAMAADKTAKEPKKQHTSSTPAVSVSAADAKATALAAAGLEEANVTGFTCQANKEVYKIAFAVDQVRYKYEISVLTGDVLKEEISRPRVDPSESERITSAHAEAAALAEAGLTRDEVKGIHSYLTDYASGIPSAYCVEFAVYNAASHHTSVYSCTVDLLTGEVVSVIIR